MVPMSMMGIRECEPDVMMMVFIPTKTKNQKNNIINWKKILSNQSQISLPILQLFFFSKLTLIDAVLSYNIKESYAGFQKIKRVIAILLFLTTRFRFYTICSYLCRSDNLLSIDWWWWRCWDIPAPKVTTLLEVFSFEFNLFIRSFDKYTNNHISIIKFLFTLLQFTEKNLKSKKFNCKNISLLNKLKILNCSLACNVVFSWSLGLFNHITFYNLIE